MLHSNPGPIHQTFTLDLPRPRRRTDAKLQHWKERLLSEPDDSQPARSRSVPDLVSLTE